MLLTRREFIKLAALATAGATLPGCDSKPSRPAGLPEGLSFAGDGSPDPTLAPDTILLRVSVAPNSVVPFARAALRQATAKEGIWLGAEDPRLFFRTLVSDSPKQEANSSISFMLTVAANSNEAGALRLKHPEPVFATALKTAVQRRSNALVEAAQDIAKSFGDKSGEHEIAFGALTAYTKGRTLNEGEIQAVGKLLSTDGREARRVIHFVDPKDFLVSCIETGKSSNKKQTLPRPCHRHFAPAS